MDIALQESPQIFPVKVKNYDKQQPTLAENVVQR